MPNITPFYEKHIALGGKIVDFFGWELPVQYTTITQEHNAVRNAAGLFDISHMGQLFVWGPQAASFLNYLVTNDVEKAPVGKGIYAHLLNENGGVIDDLFIYRLPEDRFLLILNASRREADLAWIKSKSKGYDVDMIEPPYPAALALQGPKAIDVMEKLSADVRSLQRFGIMDLNVGDFDILVARTGYTGEDGFELFAPAAHLLLIFDILIKQGASSGLLPCGLGARDTLRTEVAYPLYGHELDESHTPLEAGLEWVIRWNKGDFIGRSALEKQKKEGTKNHLCGFKIAAGGVARPGGQIFQNGKEVGIVASGTFSPTLNEAIGMAYLPTSISKDSAQLQIRQGTRELSAVTAKLPFYKKPILTKTP